VRSTFDDLQRLPKLRPAEIAARCFPDSPMTIVPLALSLATVTDSAEQAIFSPPISMETFDQRRDWVRAE
jgi:hypothetical protein